MNYYSTKHQTPAVSLKEAVIQGLPSDNGLFMPEHIKSLPKSFFNNISELSFADMAFEVANTLIGEDIDTHKLREIIDKTITFEAELKSLDPQSHVLELFHGPTFAFKDFGARFMANTMSYFVENSGKQLHILVATSGDTGSAVANGFLGVPNISVTVLYPKGKVSLIQEKQFTTLGQNITALEIDGTFDDCQSLVKQAFMDSDIQKTFFVSSANSINIARLIPQSFYYFRAYAQLKNKDLPLFFVIPSGNFGNLTAGIFAKKMGLPISKFIAATNLNKIIPDFLKTGNFEPKPSVQTISNAMDVGNPSNFARIADLYANDLAAIQTDMKGYFYDDQQTQNAMIDCKKRYDYILDPHGAIGYLAWKDFEKEFAKPANGIILETAHPAKFLEVVEQTLNEKVEIPARLLEFMEKPTKKIPLSKEFAVFKDFLMSNLKN